MSKIISTLWIGNAPAVDWHGDALEIAVGVVLVERVGGFKSYIAAVATTGNEQLDATRIAERGNTVAPSTTRALFGLPADAPMAS